MHLPKISIITPSYNQGAFLEQTILSVIQQNYANLEYIIIDGGSTDNSVEIIKKYEKHLFYWQSEKDNGQSSAINKGLKMATGEIVNWLNSDDYYEPYSLFKVATAFKNTSTNVVCGKSAIVQESKILKYTNGTDIYLNNLAKTIGWARIDQPETFFRRSVIEKGGYVNENLHYLMDRELWINYLFDYGLDNIVRIQDVLVNFRLHPDSKTVSQKPLFLKERDSLYYAIAKNYGFELIKDTLKKVSNIDENLVFQSKTKYQRKLAQKVLNYFMLLKANELYIEHKKKKTGYLLKNIDRDLLQQEDNRLLRKLQFRNRFVPKRIIRLFRKK